MAHTAHNRLKAITFSRRLGESGDISIEMMHKLLDAIPKNTKIIGFFDVPSRASSAILCFNEDWPELAEAQQTPEIGLTVTTDDLGNISVEAHQ